MIFSIKRLSIRHLDAHLAKSLFVGDRHTCIDQKSYIKVIRMKFCEETPTLYNHSSKNCHHPLMNQKKY